MGPKKFYDKACELDLLGKESEAISFYEKAYEGISELSVEDQKGLLLGMGSTYRWIDEPEKSCEVFNIALKNFPDAIEFVVFRSLSYLDIQRQELAVADLIELGLNKIEDKGLQMYKRALKHQVERLRDSH